MNERSSRAHSLLIIRLKQWDEESGMALESRFILADLGGAEQVKDSKVTGEQLKEAVFINLGLLALKKCINALQNRQAFIPYGDSMLTKLLSGALGGNSKTGAIICASKEPVNSLMTMQTLRFGEKCRQIENKSVQARGIALGVLEAINKEIKEMEALIKTKERWENRLVEVVDIEGVEVRNQTYLTGAEEERKRLEVLLNKRAAFFGQIQ
uniref:Kinesin motor domain-containing protein n=1 Tax=Lotharella oceanica TaxID=641309 RepID=A0A7S2TR96_9EUKA